MRFLKIGRKSDSTLFVVLAALAVAVPTLAFLWSVTRAMENDTAARQQEQAELLALRLADAQRVIGEHLARLAETVENPGARAGAGRFLEIAESGISDGVIVFDSSGMIGYPILPEHRNSDALSEVELDVLDLRDRYSQKFGSERDRVKPGLRVLSKFTTPGQRTARNTRGRIVYPNLLLAVIRGIGQDHSEFGVLSSELKNIVLDYSGEPRMPSSQRLFLSGELAKIDPGFVLPAEKFESFTAVAMGQQLPELKPGIVTRIPGSSGVWGLPSKDLGLLYLFREKRLQRELEEAGAGGKFSLALLPPSARGDGRTIAAGAQLPGWKLQVTSPNSDGGLVGGRRNFYIATASIALALVGLLAWLAARGYLRQAKETKLRNDFLSTVSHELRTPLTSTRMLIDTLAAGHYKDPERTKKYLGVISRETARLSHLVETFLTYSRMERGKLNFDFQDCAPADIAEHAADAVRERFAMSGVGFETDIAADLPLIEADGDTLTTALINLIDNAFKYTGSEKRIRLAVAARGSEVGFSVEDNGEGISARDRKRVVERFYRADSALARASGGSGLGLSIVKFIADGHHGELYVESTVGKGSTFTILIPAKR